MFTGFLTLGTLMCFIAAGMGSYLGDAWLQELGRIVAEN